MRGGAANRHAREALCLAFHSAVVDCHTQFWRLRAISWPTGPSGLAMEYLATQDEQPWLDLSAPHDRLLNAR